MGSEIYCACGAETQRTYETLSGRARGGSNCVSQRRLIGSTTKLCFSCSMEYLSSLPSHEHEQKTSEIKVCDFCNAEMNHGFLGAFWHDISLPKITKWSGRVRPKPDRKKTVCKDCHRKLDEFITEKKQSVSE